MIEKHVVIKGIDYWTIWYATELVHHKGVITYKQADFIKGKTTEFETLITNLNESPEDIKKHFKSNCRNEINRAEKEGIKADYYIGDEVTNETIDAFCDFFHEFWTSKGLEDNYDDNLRQEMRLYRDSGSLAITAAIVADDRLVYHTYLLDEIKVRLWHSASLYRESEEGACDRKLVGYANRYLHYGDMLHLSQMGYSQYDWGGAGHSPEVANITKFKEAFGGEPRIDYDFKLISGLDTYCKLVFKKLMRK